MAKNLYAVIIGINAYPYNPLAGCVNDAMAVNAWFENLCAAQNGLQWHPHYLLAPNSDDINTIPELRNLDMLRPTRENIIAAFDHFKQAKDGDYCLLYYSGHGSTAPAPQVFKGYTPGDMLQSVVCQDSRVNGTPDLLDKELGYLIATALEGKEPAEGKEGVHFLAFMDCCHSGTITRSMDDFTPVARMAQPGFAPDAPLGFDPKGNAFYAPFKPGQTTVSREGGLRHARYISISGARDSESAYEIFFNTPEGRRRKRGVFTWSVLETLTQGGVNISYGDLIRRAEMSVRARVDNQIPQLGKTEMNDDNLLFMRNGLKTPEQRYTVMFERGEWRMNAGAINGIIAASGKKRALVKLNDGRPVSVIGVEASWSLLDPAAFNAADEQNLTLSATILEMPFPTTKIGFSNSLSAEMRTTMEQAFAEQKPIYATLVNEQEVPQYLITPMPDHSGTICYALCRPGSTTPVFMRTPNSTQFVADTAKVARYDHVIQMNNPNTALPRNAVKVEVKVLEGVEFGIQTLAGIPDSSFVPVPLQSAAAPFPEVVKASGSFKANGKIQQPAIKVRITPQAGPCWVGALFCDPQCDITPDFLPIQQIGGPGEAPFVDLKFSAGNSTFEAIPLKINTDWKKIGVTEIQDHLIIFVSTHPFNLDHFKQHGIELDTTRSAGFDEEELVKEDWFTIKIPIKVSIPKEKQELSPGVSKDFGAFSIVAPEGFTATAATLNRSTAQQGRGLDGMPPASLWDGVEGRPEVFARGVSIAPDAHLSMVELTQVSGELSETNPLLIEPSDPLEVDETIVPFAYDAERDLYYPIGFTNAEGQIVIEHLPKLTDGVLLPAAEGERTLGSSLKMFFQKLVWSKITGRTNYNKLALIPREGTPVTYTGTQSTSDQAALTSIREAVQKGDILLVIHGIIGDHEATIPFLQADADYYTRYAAILTFEYENLDTEIQKTATILQRFLSDAQVPAQKMTILAHSMGGLVSRHMIEKLDGGAAPVQRLIQMGSPNGGSEINAFRNKLFGWIELGINGIDALKPYLPLCSIIWKGVDKRLFRTLTQMQPQSEFLLALNDGSAQRTVPYFLMAGNTSIIESSAGDDETILKQIYVGLKERGKYILADYAIFGNEPNDIAVRVDSMKEVPGGFVNIIELACDHMSYFSCKVLKELLIAPSI